MGDPVKAGIFWMGGTSPLSLGIRWFTRETWKPGLAEVNHTGLIFCDAMGPTEVHEALFGDGYCRQSPDKLLAFVHGAKRRKLIFGWLPHDAAAVLRLFNASTALIGKASYAADQIVGFMVCQSLLGRALNLTLGDDPRRVVCSEVVGRLLFQELALDLRERPTQSFDALTPQGALDVFRACYRSTAEE